MFRIRGRKPKKSKTWTIRSYKAFHDIALRAKFAVAAAIDVAQKGQGNAHGRSRLRIPIEGALIVQTPVVGYELDVILTADRPEGGRLVRRQVIGDISQETRGASWETRLVPLGEIIAVPREYGRQVDGPVYVIDLEVARLRQKTAGFVIELPLQRYRVEGPLRKPRTPPGGAVYGKMNTGVAEAFANHLVFQIVETGGFPAEAQALEKEKAGLFGHEEKEPGLRNLDDA